MSEERNNNHNGRPEESPADLPAPERKKSSRAVWTVFLVFFVFVIIVFLTRKNESIDWIVDYEAGIKQAKQQNKPVLLAFYKQFTPYTTATFQDTYKSPEVIKFVEADFVPILINVDEQPALAERYQVGYYPTHYVQRPDSNDLFGPLMGYDPPELFIKKLKEQLQKMGAADP